MLLGLIRYLKHSEIDKAKWDDCIDHAVNGIFYAYSWYLDILSPGWDALEENDYQKVFPLTFRKKFGVLYLYQPVFTQYLGLFSKEKTPDGKIPEFLNNIPQNFKFAEININTLEKLSGKYKTTSFRTCLLNMNKSYDLLRSGYSDNAKRNLKLAIKSKLLFSNKVTPEALVRLFLLNKGKEIKTIGGKDYDSLKKLLEVFLSKNMANIFGVYSANNELCAAAAFVESHGKSVFYFSASNKEARTNGAMTYLMDQFISKNSGRSLILDFEGSNNENLARFYKSFGSEEHYYLHLRKDDLPYLKSRVLKIKKQIFD
jgi:hypothetical protein